MRRIVDISLPTEPSLSERVPLQVRRVAHTHGALEMEEIFGIPRSALPEGLGWAGEELTLITHAGTHMDAPYHYGPRTAGLPSKQIAEIPLEWCYAAGFVLDVRDVPDGEEIRPQHLKQASAKLGSGTEGATIALLMTGADTYWGSPDYPQRGGGLGRSGLDWLLDRGVRIVGIDAWGLDRSFERMREEYERTGDSKHIWPAHFAGREREYCQLEKLARLSELPPAGFHVACFPIKISGAGAAWVRAVGILEEADRV